MTIKDFRGIPRLLSDEVYILGPDPIPPSISDSVYVEGVQVRLIAGVDDSPDPGYHFAPGYVTVCRVDADHAEFVGVKRTNIKPVQASI